MSVTYLYKIHCQVMFINNLYLQSTGWRVFGFFFGAKYKLYVPLMYFISLEVAHVS